MSVSAAERRAPRSDAPSVSLRQLDNSPLGWMTVQAVFDHAGSTTREYFGHAPTGTEGQYLFARVMADSSAARVEVFEIILHQGTARTVGFATLGSGYPNTEAAYVHLMVIDERFRKLGIGSAAVQALENYAAQFAKYLTLVCNLPETRSTRFWRKNGYTSRGKLGADMIESPDDKATIERFAKEIGVEVASELPPDRRQTS